MPGIARPAVSFEYEPSSTLFHSHSTNLPHLSSWIEDLVRMTERSIPIQSTPSTEALVQALQRYDACFKELYNQTKLFSDDLSKLYSKMWIGVLRLMDTMIKVYHRYVKQTSKTQEHAQKLISERQAQLAAQKVNNEEVDLERAALRAKIRNLEGEISGLGNENRNLERENRSLRDIVERFVESKGLDAGETDFPMVDELSSGFSPSKKLSSLYDAGQAQLKVVCNLDADMNEIMNNVLKEEDRQRFVLQEFSNLLDQNADLLGITPEINARGEKLLRPVTRDVGIQSDEIIGCGVVKMLEPDEDESLPAVPRRIPPTAPSSSPVALGADIPKLLRIRMSSYPIVLRIPPTHWTVKSLYAVYFAMIRHQDLVVKKPDAALPNALNKAKMPLWEFALDFYVKQFHVPSIAEVHLCQLLRACDHHKRKNKSVLVFSLQMGLTSKESLPDYDESDTDFILKVIRELSKMGELVGDLHFDDIDIDNAQMPSNLGGSVIGSNSLQMLGTTANGGHFSLTQSIMSVGSQNKTSVRLSQKNTALKPGEFRSDILKASAVATTKVIFENFYPDKGEDCAMKVAAMPSTRRDGNHISIHDYLELTIDQYKGVRLVWLDHLQYLFATFSCVYHAVRPLTFFNDQGSRGRDAVLVLTSRAGPGEPKKRVVNFYERFVSAAKTNELHRSKRDKFDETPSDYSRDWVYELMPKKVFGAVLNLIKPDISELEVAEMYNEACIIQNDMSIAKLEQIWERHPTRYPDISASDATVDDSKLPRHFYVNKITATSQWAIPYFTNSFPAVDIEQASFERCIMNRDILEKRYARSYTSFRNVALINYFYSPLLEFFHMNPKDLWSNTDMFYRQMEQARLKEKRMKHQTIITQQRIEASDFSSP